MIYGRVGANNTAELGHHGGHRADRRPSASSRSIPIALPHRPALHRDGEHALHDDPLRRRACAPRRGVHGQTASSGVSPPTFLQRPHDRPSRHRRRRQRRSSRASSFGLVMALASCHYGLAMTGGAPGVGRAVNATVVTSAAGDLRPRLLRHASRSRLIA